MGRDEHLIHWTVPLSDAPQGAKASGGVGRESSRQVGKVITFKNIRSLGEEKIPHTSSLDTC